MTAKITLVFKLLTGMKSYGMNRTNISLFYIEKTYPGIIKYFSHFIHEIHLDKFSTVVLFLYQNK